MVTPLPWLWSSAREYNQTHSQNLLELISFSANARGLMSGILQQGYSFGYVLAACANLGVGGATETWKTVFWIAGMY